MPIANAIGIAINTRVSVELLATSPRATPTVKLVGFPSFDFDTMTMRCEPFGVFAGILKFPITEPSGLTTAEPIKTGVEKSHASTVPPGVKPASFTRTTSPAFRRTFPSESNGRAVPFSSKPPSSF